MKGFLFSNKLTSVVVVTGVVVDGEVIVVVVDGEVIVVVEAVVVVAGEVAALILQILAEMQSLRLRTAQMFSPVSSQVSWLESDNFPRQTDKLLA